jgi:hypothetical protein
LKLVFSFIKDELYFLFPSTRFIAFPDIGRTFNFLKLGEFKRFQGLLIGSGREKRNGGPYPNFLLCSSEKVKVDDVEA